MSLIICPECGKQVSDKASICVHCGFPIAEKTDVVKYYALFYNCQHKKNKLASVLVKALRELMFYYDDDAWIKAKEVIKNNQSILTGLSYSEAEIMQKKLETMQVYTIIAESVESNDKKTDIEKYITLHCPKCGSTSITTGARGVDGFWGFFGASRTVNRCANCGHSWEPRG